MMPARNLADLDLAQAARRFALQYSIRYEPNHLDAVHEQGVMHGHADRRRQTGKQAAAAAGIDPSARCTEARRTAPVNNGSRVFNEIDTALGP